jgi:hypothetical protein
MARKIERDPDDIAPTPHPHAFLISLHYRRLGADRYDGQRFHRLCAAWGETPVEMAARIGLDASALSRRLAKGQFNSPGSNAESILLHQLERFIFWQRNGAEPPTELFPPQKVQ